MYSLIHSINKKSIIFLYFFTWYQSHGRLGLGFFHGSKFGNPSRGHIALWPPHLHLWNPPLSSYHLSYRKDFSATFLATLLPVGDSTFGIASAQSTHRRKNLRHKAIHSPTRAGFSLHGSHHALAHGPVSSHPLLLDWSSLPDRPP